MKMTRKTCRLIWAALVLVVVLFVGSVIGIGGKNEEPATPAGAVVVANGAGALVANAEPIVVPAKPTATPAPTAVTTQAPTALLTAAPTQAPTALPTAASTATPAPTATPTPALTSREASQLCIRKDTTAGKQWTLMILRNDLERVKYEEIVVTADAWDGVDLLANSKGVVGEIWGLEKWARDARRNAGTLKDLSRVKQEWLNSRGEFIGRDEDNGHVREGYARLEDELVHVALPAGAVRFVRLAGEDNYRMVVVAKGTPYNWGGEGGTPTKTTPKPTSKPKPTPVIQPTAKPTPVIQPTAEPTKAPVTQPPAVVSPTPKPAPVTQPPAVVSPTPKPAPVTQAPAAPTAKPVVSPTPKPAPVTQAPAVPTAKPAGREW